MKRIAAISFDLDETLLYYRRSAAELLALSFETCGIDPFFSAEEYVATFDEHTGTVDSIEEVRSACFTALARERGYDPEIGSELAAVYSKNRDHRNVMLYPGAVEVLGSLGAQYPLALITNGPRSSQMEKIAETGIDEWFDIMVFAGEDTAPKPDPEPFEVVCTELDVPPAATVHIGNSLESDVAGAASAGLRAVWVSNGNQLTATEADYEVSEINEVLSLPLF